jgi:hypothetical protein
MVCHSEKLSFFRPYFEGRLHGELNIFFLWGRYFESKLLVGKFFKIKLPKFFLLICYPLFGLFFVLPPLLLHGFLQSVQRLLKELAFSQIVADVIFEGDQVLHKFLVGDQCVELIVESIVRSVPQHLPELGGLFHNHISELAVEARDEIGVQFFLPLRNPGELEQSKVDLVGQ